ncbi:MAG: hypothetical protein OHK0017_11600 [Patescibacteria group bacterium]
MREKLAKHFIAEKTAKRKLDELKELEDKYLKLKAGMYGRARRFMENELNNGLLDHQGLFYSPASFIFDPNFQVHLLPPDNLSPFATENGRQIVTHWGYIQTGHKASKYSLSFFPFERLPDNLDFKQLPPDDEIAIFTKFLEICNGQAEQGKLVTWTGAEGEMSSILYPLHVQCLTLKDGIEFNQFDETKCINLEQMPELITKANDNHYMLSFRFVGNRKVLVYGFYPHGYSEEDEPKLPDIEPANTSLILRILLTFALRPGAVEAFTNALAPNELLLDFVGSEGGIKVISLDNIRTFIDGSYHQFDGPAFLKKLNY